MKKLTSLLTSGFVKRALDMFLKFPRLIIFFLCNFFPMYATEIAHTVLLKEIFLVTSKRVPASRNDTNLTSLVYLSVFHLLKFKLTCLVGLYLPLLVVAITTGYFATRGNKEERQRLSSNSRLKETLIKYISTAFASFVAYAVVVTWFAVGGLVGSSEDTFYKVLYVVGFVAFLEKRMELNSVWNVGVVAISKGENRCEALRLSAYFSNYGKLSAFVMVLFNFVWCFCGNWERLRSKGVHLESMAALSREDLNIEAGRLMSAFIASKLIYVIFLLEKVM